MSSAGPPPPSPAGPWRERLLRWRERLGRLQAEVGRATGTLLLVVFCVLMALGIVQLSVLGIGSVYQIREWQTERRELREGVARLQTDLTLLREVQVRLNRPETLTELARCQGFVGGQEDIHVSSDPVPANPGNCDAPRLP